MKIACIMPDLANIPAVQHFAEGCGGTIVSQREYVSDPAAWDAVAFYGKNHEAADAAQKGGRDFFCIDKPYIDWPDEHRITLNASENVRYRIRPDDRMKAVHMKPWRGVPDDSAVVLFGEVETWAPKSEADGWSQALWNHVFCVGYTSIRVVGFKTGDAPGNVMAAVIHSGPEAVGMFLAGIPVIVSEESILHSASRANFMNLWKEDRHPVINHISYSQFSLAEMADGTAMNILLESVPK